MTLDLETLDLDQLRAAPPAALSKLANDIRRFMIDSNSPLGAHRSELGYSGAKHSVALHFSSPEDIFIFDTGHSGYTLKILTGRVDRFKSLNTTVG